MSKRKMPVIRDISVPVHDSEERIEGIEIAKTISVPGTVTVMGFDKNDVLFRTNQAGTVQWRDSNGKIVALLVRLKPDVWGFSKVGDDDWLEVLGMCGNPDAN